MFLLRSVMYMGALLSRDQLWWLNERRLLFMVKLRGLFVILKKQKKESVLTVRSWDGRSTWWFECQAAGEAGVSASHLSRKHVRPKRRQLHSFKNYEQLEAENFAKCTAIGGQMSRPAHVLMWSTSKNIMQVKHVQLRILRIYWPRLLWHMVVA